MHAACFVLVLTFTFLNMDLLSHQMFMCLPENPLQVWMCVPKKCLLEGFTYSGEISGVQITLCFEHEFQRKECKLCKVELSKHSCRHKCPPSEAITKACRT